MSKNFWVPKTERSLSGQRVTFGKRNELNLQRQHGLGFVDGY